MSVKNTIKTIIIAIVLASCSNDLLDKFPNDKISNEIFWKSASDAQLALNGCYNRLDGSYSNVYIDAYSDNAYAQYPWESNATVIGAGDITPSINAGYNFVGIRRFNFFLDNIDKAPISEALKQLYIAEVRTLRAFSYFNLAQRFGPVPLFKKSLEQPEDAMVKPTSEAEVIRFVIDELAAAIPNLPERAEAKSRFSKGAALALKARVHLYYSEWNEAASAAAQVMQMGYSLFRVGALTAMDLKDDYSRFVDFADDADKERFYKGLSSYEQQFWEKNENNNEVILSVEYLPKDASFSSRLNTFLLPGDVGGWSSITPTQSLVNSYWNRDGSAFTPPTPAERAARYNKGDYGDEFLKEFRNRDPRLYASILFPGAMMSAISDGFIFKWSKGAVNITPTGYNFRKLVDPSDPSYATDENAPQDFPLIRYAEVLLIYAEAKNEAEATPSASIYDAIDQLRVRAGMPSVDRAAVASQAQMRALIRNERRIELAAEGFRWADICRWDIAQTEMKTIFAIDNDKAQDRVWDNKFKRMPYPQTAVDRNPQLSEAQKAKGY